MQQVRHGGSILKTEISAAASWVKSGNSLFWDFSILRHYQICLSPAMRGAFVALFKNQR